MSSAQVIITRWASDPWTLGSYSYVRVGATEATRGTAFAPTAGGRVGFAGEHCHDLFPATVHGALLSGWAEADRVAAALGVATAG